MKRLKSKIKEGFQNKKIAIVDTLGNVSYSIATGAVLDYFAGLDPAGIVASRTWGTAINSVTGGPYGWWREKVNRVTKTTEKNSKVRRTLTDLLAFNTFQVPVYAGAVAIGSLISEGEINLEKVANGAGYLTAISPIIAPTMGWYMDKIRKAFNINSAAKGAYSETH